MTDSVKRACKRIGTHDGTFHCDEVFACYMLKKTAEYKEAEIVRTRNPTLLDSCDIVVDVGGVYDHSTKRYDHHQRSFNETMSTLMPGKIWTTRLSSAGLIYLHYGRDIIVSAMSEDASSTLVDKIYDKVYNKFVEAVDAIDNGVSICEGKPRYEMTTGLSSRVGALNPAWNEKDIDIDVQFHKAMELVGKEFEDKLSFYLKSWLPARQVVYAAIQKIGEVDSSHEIACLDNGGVPWKEHLMDIEEELSLSPKIKYVLYTDTNGKWRIQCVPVSCDSFENRLSLLEEWRGIRDDELSTLSGIPGCIFVHAGGFIGGNQTYEGVLEMARRTLQHRDEMKE